MAAATKRLMRAVVVKDSWLTSLEQLQVVPWEVPTVTEGCVEIDVVSAGANFFDILLVSGKYQLKPKFPFIPGSEFAGVVKSVGEGVEDYVPGDRVFGGSHLGGYAETLVTDVKNVYRMPDKMSFHEACGLYLTYPTSYAALKLRADVQPGEKVLIHAAAGGVGIAAVQFAKAMGAEVVATCGSAEKLEVAKKAGADHLVNYRDEDWIDQVKDVSDGGVDVVFDPVGLPTESTKCMAWNARYLVVGFAAGEIPKLAMNRVLLKNISIVGIHWGAYEYNEPEAISKVWDGIFDLYEQGKIAPLVYPESFSLEELPKALGTIASRKSYGKVVIDIKPSTPKL